MLKTSCCFWPFILPNSSLVQEFLYSELNLSLHCIAGFHFGCIVYLRASFHLNTEQILATRKKNQSKSSKLNPEVVLPTNDVIAPIDATPIIASRLFSLRFLCACLYHLFRDPRDWKAGRKIEERARKTDKP